MIYYLHYEILFYIILEQQNLLYKIKDLSKHFPKIIQYLCYLYLEIYSNLNF